METVKTTSVAQVTVDIIRFGVAETLVLEREGGGNGSHFSLGSNAFSSDSKPEP